MSRPIVLGNGELHVGINRYGEVHDFYFPYVGFENHAAGKDLRHRVGVWVDGKISWLDDEGSWEFTFAYPHEALIGHTVAYNQLLGVRLEFDDTVDADFSAFMRNIHVINLHEREREIRLFMHQAFVIGDSRSNTDTAQYLPDEPAILHYRGRRAFVIGGQDEARKPFDQYTVGLFNIEGREGSHRDADDGELSGCNVEHGRVDSVIRFSATIPAHDSTRFHYWIACGTSVREALYVHKQLANEGGQKRLEVTAKWWREWLKPAQVAAKKLDPAHREHFIHSCMIIKSHTDKRGAVIASTDSSLLKYWRDAYGYCWPRDGAYVLWPLIRMGYKDEPYRFFDFCRRGLSPGGYLMHKYRADGAVGSSWHPYLHADGSVSPPIQQDGTALVLFVFVQFYHMTNDDTLLKNFYEPMVAPMADFLAHNIDKRTNLPKASYDLWEEQFMTTTYSTAVTYAALMAAADLAEQRKDNDSAVRWRAAADDMRVAAGKLLFDETRGVLYKGVRVSAEGDVTPDSTIDMSAIFGAFMFGLFSVHDDIITRSVATAEKTFGFEDLSAVPGIPRYEHDGYLTANSDRPNWWYVTTLWMAQHYLEVGKNDRAEAILEWTRDSALSTGILSEQINPQTGEEISVSPLCWSQAEYVSTLLDTTSET